MTSRRIRITSIERQPPDIRKLARALIALARARRTTESQTQSQKDGQK